MVRNQSRQRQGGAREEAALRIYEAFKERCEEPVIVKAVMMGAGNNVDDDEDDGDG